MEPTKLVSKELNQMYEIDLETSDQLVIYFEERIMEQDRFGVMAYEIADNIASEIKLQKRQQKGYVNER